MYNMCFIRYSLKDNQDVIKDRLSLVYRALDAHQKVVGAHNDEYRVFERQLLVLKGELNTLSNRRKELVSILVSKGISLDKFDLEPGDPQHISQPVC